MKYAIILLSLVACTFVSSCSKSSNAGPVPHTIKVTVTGSANFNVSLSAIKADETVNSAIDTKAVTTGTYEFTTGLVVGGLLHLEIQNSSAENTVSYTITNNGAPGTSDTNKELGSFGKIALDYRIN